MKAVLSWIAATPVEVIILVLKRVGNGDFGPALQKAYNAVAGWKSVIGLVLELAAFVFDRICQHGMVDACELVPYVYGIATVCLAVGWIDRPLREQPPSSGQVLP